MSRTGRGHQDEFIAMVKSQERIIYQVCSMYVSCEYPLEDLYQETVASLWRAYPRFRGESALSTWVYRIALNTCISGLRKSKKQNGKVELAPSFNLPEDSPEDGERIRELYDMIYSLKKIERAIVLLYLEEKTFQEIADITGLQLGNVRVRFHRIKEKLKTMSNEKNEK